MSAVDTSRSPDRPDQRSPVPAWAMSALASCLAVLTVAGVCWLVVLVLMRLALVSFTLAVAVLLTALLAPLTGRLRHAGTPPCRGGVGGAAAAARRPGRDRSAVMDPRRRQVQDLGPAVTAGIDDVRGWLTTGPLSLDPSQVDGLRDQVVSYVNRAVPSPVAGARTALHVLAALALAVFTVFFFLKDGDRMWQWALERTSSGRRPRVDGAGQAAWATLTSYVAAASMVAVAVADAVLIGGGLFLVGVPLWLSLALLTFLGAFVPILGATVTGAVAVLVTLVTNGRGDALIIFAVVLIVQQVEGNLLQPLVMGRAVHLHPVVTLVAVTCGTLLLGLPGAVLAVPLVAVTYRVAEYLRTRETPP